MTMGMRGCILTSDAEAYLELGIPRLEHKCLKDEMHDFTVGYT